MADDVRNGFHRNATKPSADGIPDHPGDLGQRKSIASSTPQSTPYKQHPSAFPFTRIITKKRILQIARHRNLSIDHEMTTPTMSRLPLRRLLLRTSPATSRITTTVHRTYSSSFRPQPGPPKLPAEQQAEFERLQRDASVSQAFQPGADTASSDAAAKTAEAPEEEVNQGIFRGAKPEFKGDTNPKTGEVGGPKNEPLRWGGQGDWSYNGRVTDF